MNVAIPLATAILPSLISSIFGKGKRGLKPKRRVSANDRRRQRGKIVAQVMRQHGMSLPDASRFVKEHCLY